MKRITAILAGTVVLAMGLALWLWLRQPSPGGSPGDPTALARQRTPVIVYLVDTLRADRLGLYGYTRRATSPRLDALAAESVVFDHAYSAAPWTLPSVASLITSTYSCEHNVTRDTNRLNPAVRTLAERLAGAGFSTAAYYGNGYAGGIAHLNRGYQVSELRTGDNERATDVQAFLRQAGEAPFFLYLHTMEPHQPFAVDTMFIRRFGHAPVEERENYRAAWHRYRELRAVDWAAKQPLGTTDNTAQQEALMAYMESLRQTVDLVYDAAVLSADEHLGQVIDVLRAAGLWDRALFIVLADHGDEFGEHQGWTHGQSVYEELVRVPLLMRFPGGEFAGRRIAATVSLVDVMPTILEYLGRAELCDGCRGESLLPLVRGEARSGPAAEDPPSLRINQQHYFRPWKEQRGDVNVVVRQAGWKGIWNAERDAVELYDLATDPGERQDLSAAEPAIAGQLGARAREWYRDCRAVAKEPEHRELDERVKESLRALGYFN